jgi:hypothetical protein
MERRIIRTAFAVARARAIDAFRNNLSNGLLRLCAERNAGERKCRRPGEQPALCNDREALRGARLMLANQFGSPTATANSSCPRPGQASTRFSRLGGRHRELRQPRPCRPRAGIEFIEENGGRPGRTAQNGKSTEAEALLRKTRSEFGLEDQRMVVCAYLKSVAGEMFATLTEVESGRNTDRAQLNEASALIIPPN